jgi:hypothetical protein
MVCPPDTKTLYMSFRVYLRKFDERKDGYVKIVPDLQAEGQFFPGSDKNMDRP